jgi:hypothetical protein
MSRFGNAVAGGQRLLVLSLALALAPAGAHAQQPKPEDLGPAAKKVLTKYCFQCHGKDPRRVSAKLKILDHAALLASNKRIVVPRSPDASLLIQRVESKDDPMPPEEVALRPSDAERKLLRAWVAAGAPGFEKAVVQAPPPRRPAPVVQAQPRPADLAFKAREILTAKCFACHGRNPKKIERKLKILDYKELLASKRKIVVPGSPDASRLIKRIESKDDPMPPEDRPQLTAAERRVLRAWVAAGAPAFPERVAVQTAAPPATIAPAPAATAAGSLEEAFLKAASQELEYLRQQGYKTVGVLKFRVKRVGETASDNVGPLNQSLANRLEMALVLANDNRNPVGILRAASGVAALIEKAKNLGTPEGQRALFGAKYPLAWGGDDPVQPEAFLFGDVRFDTRLRRMGVTLYAIGKDGKTHRQPEFIVPTDPGLLVEAGESYLLPGALPQLAPLAPAKALDAMLALRKDGPPSPLKDPAAPVRFEVLYDGKAAVVHDRNGKLSIDEPKPGQKVSFVLRRQPGALGRLAVVLKVNGESALFREQLADLQCRKWVLEPGTDTLTIDRIRTDLKDDKGGIQVLAVPKSKPDEMRYFPDTGTVSLVVFREVPGRQAAARAVPDDLAALRRGALPPDRPKDLATLKEQIRKEAAAGNAARALAAPVKDGAEPKETTFQADPTPVMAVTITCTRP